MSLEDDRREEMVSPSATVLCTCTASSLRLPPNMVVVFLLAALLATRTRSSSPSSNAAGFHPTATFCSGHTPYSRLIAGTACATSAVWHDACCFLRYSESDPSRFDEDEYTATAFKASRAVSSPHVAAKAVVRRLLAAVANSTTSSHMCRGVGAGTAAGGLYGLTRCAAGISCDDCRRCLGGALEVVEREYNGSAGMQVLRLSCMARYESYPFYNTRSLARRLLGGVKGAVAGGNASTPAATPPVPVSPGGHNPPPAQSPAPPPAAASTATSVNATIGHTPVPPGDHTPQPATAAPKEKDDYEYEEELGDDFAGEPDYDYDNEEE